MFWIYFNAIGILLTFFLIFFIRRKTEAKTFSNFMYVKKEMPIEPTGNLYSVILESNPSNIIQTNNLELILDDKGIWMIKARTFGGGYYYCLDYKDITDVELMTQGTFRGHIIIYHNSRDIVSPYKFAVRYSEHKLYDEIKQKI